MFTGIRNNPITEDLAYYNQLTKTGEAHKATCLCSRTTLNPRIPRITPNIAHANTPPQSDREPLRTFRLVLNSVKTDDGRPLVKMSAYCDVVGTCRT